MPAALGGPWRWYANGDYGYVLQTPVLTQLSWVVAAVIVIASLCLRRRGWHAWAILAGWVVLCDLLPVIFSRVGRSGGGLLGLDLQYLADSLPVLAICLGLAFWPVDGEQNAYRFALRAAGVRRAAVCVLLGCFLAGSVWSARAYLTDTTSAPVSSYIATATAAVRRAPANTMVIPSPVPAAVMDPGIFGSSASTQQVIDPLARGRLRWTTAPQGQIRNLMIFDSLGRLKAAAVQGPVSLPAPGGRPCWPVLATGTRIPLTGSLYSWTWTVQLWYSGPASTLQVQYGRAVHAVTVPAGSHDVYVPATGGGSALIISSNSASGSAPDCVSRLAVGSLQPSADAIPIPFYPVR